ncbi:lytic murein transglycosylase [Hasllibacter halocynthiae]|uniref:Lytic murein transglycosylase n=1 Tax=Hasllibacter halocynthiae TaxID=595589 RepID=A0A2T0X373_9RHOB|nr:lytic murein transglycosylase [Hasllibacter halocynthiae]PRY93399.1 lytic murein transglycosylase [Hasllibacter halocynthiae]
MPRPLALVLALLAAPAAAQDCGGPFPAFLDGLRAEAVAGGHDAATVDAFLAGVRQDERTLAADRRQGVFQLPFTDFARRIISGSRIEAGRQNADRHAPVFDRIEGETGIPAGVMLAFWALETDYGAFQGDYGTLNSLVTLAHDCRRPELFRPQIFAALDLYERGGFDPAGTTGAWAGEIGMVQMLPEDILNHGTDADGDGRVDLKGSAPDALVSGARMLAGLGWRPGEPWLLEAVVPAGLDPAVSGLEGRRPMSEWRDLGVVPRTGDAPADLPAALLLPQGANGPAFLAFPNFGVYLEWNQSLTYAITAAYLATRLEGAPVFDSGNPRPGIGDGEMRELQRRLAARGHDVGEVDGILGAGTRAAVRAEQARLGLPVDGWPDARLLGAL